MDIFETFVSSGKVENVIDVANDIGDFFKGFSGVRKNMYVPLEWIFDEEIEKFYHWNSKACEYSNGKCYSAMYAGGPDKRQGFENGHYMCMSFRKCEKKYHEAT